MDRIQTGNEGRGMAPLTGHRKTLFLLVLAYTLSMCDRMILSILFPQIKAEFGITDTQLGLLGGSPSPFSTPPWDYPLRSCQISTTANGSLSLA